MSRLENLMDPNDILEGFESLFAQAHAILDGSDDLKARRLLALFHAAGNAMWDHLGGREVGGVIVRPFDGTNKP